MGGQAQPSNQVYYDPEMGQYYTQEASLQDANNMYMRSYPTIYGNKGPHNVTASNLFSSMFGTSPNNGRTYLGNIGRNSADENTSPYAYADVSLESLFPSMNQGGGNSALAGLLGSAPSATGSASSGAGRFM